jgi:hypothetical protein
MEDTFLSQSPQGTQRKTIKKPPKKLHFPPCALCELFQFESQLFDYIKLLANNF